MPSRQKDVSSPASGSSPTPPSGSVLASGSVPASADAWATYPRAFVGASRPAASPGAWASSFPAASPWWYAASCSNRVSPAPFDSDVNWGKDPRPPGGFMSYLQNQPPLSRNFHFVGGPSHCAPFKPPRPLHATWSSQSPAETTAPNLGHVNVDSDDSEDDDVKEVVRTSKRILWTSKEDERLMGSWLKNSMDPICGNDKKNEQYWGDVAKTYNSTTPKDRVRSMKQCKDRWHKINRWTNLFHSAWIKARRIYQSGYSNEMWIDKAHKFYESENKLGRYTIMEVWYAVRDLPKWLTYNDELKKARKRKETGTGQAGEKEETSEPIDVEEPPSKRPTGQKKAKKLARAMNGKSNESAVDVDELEKFREVQSESHTNRLKVLEFQQKLSSEKLESSRLSQLAAKDNKDAKMYEKDAKMYEKEAKICLMKLGLSMLLR